MKTKFKVLLSSGEIVKSGTLLRLDVTAFVNAESDEYDPLKFMAWSCEDVDLRGKPPQPIWAELKDS